MEEGLRLVQQGRHFRQRVHEEVRLWRFPPARGGDAGEPPLMLSQRGQQRTEGRGVCRKVHPLGIRWLPSPGRHGESRGLPLFWWGNRVRCDRLAANTLSEQQVAGAQRDYCWELEIRRGVISTRWWRHPVTRSVLFLPCSHSMLYPARNRPFRVTNCKYGSLIMSPGISVQMKSASLIGDMKEQVKGIV